jgi:hypothetical protein
MNESDETDKKIFLKVASPYENQDDLEKVLNVPSILFRMSSEKKAS